MSEQIEIPSELLVVVGSVLVKIQNVSVIKDLTKTVKQLAHSDSIRVAYSVSLARKRHKEKLSIGADLFISADYHTVISDKGLRVLCIILGMNVVKRSYRLILSVKIIHSKRDNVRLSRLVGIPEASLLGIAFDLLLRRHSSA